MTHPEPEELALLALGEDRPRALAHVETCERCRLEVESLSRVVDPVRGPLISPPARVWDAIANDLALTPDSDSGTDTAAMSTPTANTSPAPAPASRPPSRRWIWTLAAGIAIGGLGYGAIDYLTADSTPQVLAEADLEPLPGWDEAGTAQVTDASGALELTVSVSGSQVSGDREVWLISPDLTKMVSLGFLAEDSATFTVPDGVDLAEYSIVDVSDEPPDGDPTHSGVSIVRGVLSS